MIDRDRSFRQRLRFTARYGAALAPLWLAVMPTAQAADAADKQARPASQSADSDDSTSGGAIIVTARKTKETLQDVPQSITVFSEKNLVQYNIQSFDDYAGKIPNLSFNAGSTGRANFTSSRAITIRGVAGANTTSLYIDDTPIPASQDPRIVDVERIEVLKGPQGTLYGSAAIGGTVRIVTKQPELDHNSAKYMLQGGWTDHGGSPNYGGNAIANLVLLPDAVAVRVMGFVNHDAGYITRTYPLTESSGTPSVQRGAQNDVGAGLQYGGSISLRAKLSEEFSANVKMLAQREDYDNGPALVYRGNPGFDPTSLTVDRDYNVPESSHNYWYSPSLTLVWSKPKWSVTSSTSYFYQHAVSVEDVSEAMHGFVGTVLGYNNFGGVAGGGVAVNRQFQQELRLAANPLRDLNLLAGAYYLSSITATQSSQRVVPGFAASPAGQAWGATQDVYFALGDRANQKQKALFGEASYKAFNLVTATAGVRRFWIDQSDVQNLLGFIVGDNTTTYSTSSFRNTGWSPRFSLRVEPRSSTTFYASAAKGFRPGGAGSKPLTQCMADIAALGLTAADVTAGYKPDSVWTYEVGAKQSLLKNHLLVTGAAFQTDWKNIQQTISLRCGSDFTGNAGAARIRGLEGEITGTITRELSVRGGIGYTEAIITNDAGGTTAQAVGSSLYNVPKWTASAGTYYNRALTSTLHGFGSVDWQYVSSSTSSNNSTSSPAVRGAYAIVNLRAGLQRDKDELSFYINNLTNRMANYGDHIPDIASNFTLTTGQSVPHTRVAIATPLTIGLQFRHGF